MNTTYGRPCSNIRLNTIQKKAFKNEYYLQIASKDLNRYCSHETNMGIIHNNKLNQLYR